MPAVILGMGAFMATFDITAVSLALPSIGTTLSIPTNDLVWVMNVYSMTFTVVLIVAGTLADQWGPKPALIFGTSIFLISSGGCGFADSFRLLIAGRLVQGIGAAFILCGGYAMMSQLYSEKAQRIQAFAIMGTISGSAMAVGPGLGGILSSTLGWPWIFFLNIPVCLVIVGALCRVNCVKSSDCATSIDFLGIAAFGVLMLVASWCMIHGPSLFDVRLSLAVAAGLVAFLAALFIVIELTVRRPAVDLTLLARRTFCGLAIVPICLAFSYWAPLVFLPILLESVFRLDGLSASYVMLAFTCPMFLVPYLATGLATRIHEGVFFSYGLLGVATGSLLISAGAHFVSIGLSMLGMALAGSSAAAIQNQVSGALIAAAPADRSGTVTALMTILRQGGFVLGTALLSAVMSVLQGISSNEFPFMFVVCASISLVGAVATRILVSRDEKSTRGGAYAN
ncbi:MFS transporter [Variovorax sp. J22P271]|uniref:MFS transporter n=1 Tax=Variovorax davisae TaxID=3053515 RepID=UPI002576881B|nr:MFS transporter [Variovorax sp. J22P271]MDM0030595.1 MFS transporter [Variovorax sp. J22P271]